MDSSAVGFYKYGLGYPFDEIRAAFAEAAAAMLHVFELRGTEEPFQVTILTVDPGKSEHDPAFVVGDRQLHPPKDYSVTNSRDWTDSTLRLQSLTEPTGSRYTLIYDSTGRVRRMVDQLNTITTLLWDASSNRTGIINPAGTRMTYGYNSQGQTGSINNPLGQLVTRIYDSSGRVVAEINPLGFRTSFGYDSHSQMQRRVDPLGNIVRDSY
jgi:YD repeat-containing protein